MDKIKLIIFILIISTKSFAHGENILGPHKGFIRMPGTFHTELVPNSNNTFTIYLMDVNNKNPVTKNSTVVLKNKSLNGVLKEFPCTLVGDHFVCTLGIRMNSLKGQMIIKAKRNEAIGEEAVYELPLKLELPKHDMSKM